jgi:hypothetical protein
MDKTSSCAIWQHNGDCWAKHLITQKLHQKGVLMRRYYFPVGHYRRNVSNNQITQQLPN